MRRTKRFHTITVRGKGIFPVDMLRHDRLFPLYEEDATEIAESYHLTSGTGRDRRQIKLGGIHSDRWEPTHGRWESFGWKVRKHESEGVVDDR